MADWWHLTGWRHRVIARVAVPCMPRYRELVDYVEEEAKTTRFDSPPIALSSCSAAMRKAQASRDEASSSLDGDANNDNTWDQASGLGSVAGAASPSFLPWGYEGLYGIDSRVCRTFKTEAEGMDQLVSDEAGSGGPNSVERGDYGPEVRELSGCL